MFVYVTIMLCDLMKSLHTSTFLKRIPKNTATLLTQRGGNPLIASKSIKINHSTRPQIKLILELATVGNTMTTMEVYLPSQLLLVTSVTERASSKGITNPMKMALVGIHKITP